MAEKLSIYEGVVMRLKFFKYNALESEKSIIEYAILKVLSISVTQLMMSLMDFIALL